MSAKKPSSAPPAPSDLETFRDLFWKARAVHRQKLKQTNSQAAEHQGALAFAQKHNWAWAETLLEGLLRVYRRENDQTLEVLNGLEAPLSFSGELWFVRGVAEHALKNWDGATECYRRAIDSPAFGALGSAWINMGLAHAEKKEWDCAIECYHRALEVPASDSPGVAWNSMGLAHAGKKEWDRAIECYLKALETARYESSGKAWNNMGLAHAGKKEWDRAIECYRKALEDLDSDMRGGVWNNIGVAHAGKKEWDRAMECYHRALEASGFDSPGFTWNNMGSAHVGKKEWDLAIKCYRKALDLPQYDTPGRTRLNLSIALREKDQLSEAEEEIQKALKEPDAADEEARAQHLLTLIRDLKRGIETKEEDKALGSAIPSNIADEPEGRMWQALLERKTKYDAYLAASVTEHPDELTILRGWSSSVTLLEGAEDTQWSGGGYFLKWQGKGLVIDPGFDFLDNFHQAGFHAREIAAIVVSHNHPDHNADLRSLDDLCYEMFRVDASMRPILFAMDEDSGERFGKTKPVHRGSPCKLGEFAYEEKRWLTRTRDLPFTIEHFPVAHGKDVPGALGLILRLHATKADGKDLVIGYTGDGKFTKDLVGHLRGVDILIAHVSQPEIAEFSDPDHLKKVHLGYNGVIKLVRELKPRLTLVGEFWAGLADLRLDLIAGIRKRSGVEAVLPACLGLSLSLPDLTIRCSRCRRQVPAERIKVAPPVKEFGLLGYLCPECIL